MWVLRAIYEEDFLGFSYGFRPGRSQHNALDAIWVAIVQRKVNWLLDADIRRFFDEIQDGWVENFVQHRIGDPRILRLIHKWLNRGGAGPVGRRTEGRPAGNVSPPHPAGISGISARSF